MRASPLDDLPRPLAIVCHDAGAANIILHAIGDNADGLRIWTEGPAERIAAALGHPRNVSNLEAALEGAATLLSGTGWASDLEHRARALASASGIVSIAVLDHWVNYPQRFIRDGHEVLPDRWWVTDRFALDEARKHFDAARIDQVANFYALDQLASVAPVSAGTPNRLLYVLEPARSTWGKDRPGEFQALDYLLERLPKLGLPSATEICLRPHPSDPPGKYDHWIGEHANMGIALDRAADISEAIGDSRWVAGCESFALALALEAGRPVFCTLPPHAPPCRLPHDRIIHIQAME